MSQSVGTNLALAAIINNTVREKRLIAAKCVTEHEMLKPRISSWVIGRDLGAVPSHCQRRRT